MDVKSKDLSKILSRYSSKWVALTPAATKVVASGSSLQTVVNKARKAGVSNPVLTRAPKDYGTYIL